jgi:site-specific DNA-methyltransferase (adenine-specific)
MSTFTLYQGDCLDRLKELKNNSIDLVVTSPPYNKKGLSGKSKIGNQIWSKFNIDYNEYGDDMNENEYQIWMIDILDELYRIIKPTGSIFFNHKPRRYNNKVILPSTFIDKSKLNLYQLIIWNRKNSPNIRKDVLLPNTEHIYWLSKGKPLTYKENLEKQYNSEVWEIIAEKQKEHPAPFPPQLVKNCINLATTENDIVLDPFMGSGTTGEVCVHTNRNFIGIEIDKKYIEIAQQRIEWEYKQQNPHN